MLHFSDSIFLRMLGNKARLLLLGLSLVGALGSTHCAGSNDTGPGIGAGGTDGSPRDKTDLALGEKTTGTDEDELPLNPLCGIGWCVPDDMRACLPTPDAGGMGGEGGESNGGAAGGLNFYPGVAGASGVSCQVGPSPNCEGSACQIERNCVESGLSMVGQPCVSASDCDAGLACVGEGPSGVCRPYCCRGTEGSCDENSFCDERRLLETPEIYVPVCLPMDHCSLTDPFPCEGERDCTCQGNRACMIVRSNGATSCTTPGAGQAGDECSDQVTADCAHGFVCGPNQTCLEICSTVSLESGCDEGWSCAKQSALGDDLGICAEVTVGETTGG